jgi:hypothetical protein
MLKFLFGVLSIAAIVYWHAPIILTALAVWFFIIHLSWLTWALSHPFKVLTSAAIYFVTGAAWSVAKWWFEETEKVRTAKERWQTKPHPQGTWEEFRKTYRNDEPDRHDVARWITFWPVSAAFTLLDDPVRRICRCIYDELQGVYKRISDHVWA